MSKYAKTSKKIGKAWGSMSSSRKAEVTSKLRTMKNTIKQSSSYKMGKQLNSMVPSWSTAGKIGLGVAGGVAAIGVGRKLGNI